MQVEEKVVPTVGPQPADLTPSEKVVGEGLTFDDVLLIPRHSAVLPRQCDVSTYLTPQIRLKICILSAAMDTVTDWQMAIAMAREGGLGVIHKNMSVERQAEAVDRVKRSESGMILNPITLGPDRPLREALEAMTRFSISGVPITNQDGRLVGILTNRDVQFETDLDQPIRELMTSEGLVTVPVGTTLEEAEKILHENRIEKLPVVDEAGILQGLITVKDINKRRQFPLASKDERGRLQVGAAVGVSPDLDERAKALVNAEADVLFLDSAHGHSENVLRATERLKEQFPDTPLVVGNVGTAEGAEALVERGVDAVKVGMGPGSICTSRVITGVGVPQISAVLDCARVTRERGVSLISDGGIRYSGDIVKALAAGANSVMIGSLLAGTEESPGETMLLEGRTFKIVRGMGSMAAMGAGSKDRYFQAEEEYSKLVPEGIEGRVPYKGEVADTVFQLVGGVKAGMGYCGVRTLEELWKETRFLRVSPVGFREGHPHDVIITREAPNYQVDF